VSAPGLAWLFDVDGTLLLTEGAGREAFAHAVAATFGVRDDLSRVAFSGRTEPLILADILSALELEFADGQERRFWDAVFARMRELLGPERGYLLPGVLDLLDAIEREPAWMKILLTGNMTEMASIKLERFGLTHRFEFGAFGEMAADRDALACLAVARIAKEHGIPAARCIVVGDTEHDIACARAAGAQVVAVCTGSKLRHELAALGPDLLLDDLRDTAKLIEWAKGVAAGDRMTAPAPDIQR